MKTLLCSLMLLTSTSALAAGFYDRDSGLYTKADSYQQLSWCDGNKVVHESGSGEIVVSADCDSAQKTCDTDVMVFNKTVIYRAVCK